ncbi:MAG: universal stress protein [Acidobacteria bacterium]|nr:universal stress protein [Acidobacteriota bacterium]MDW7984681.1 universal stress protein [Acidobacteriota bacterium]
MRLPVQIRQILFATDFSHYSDRARDYTLTLARKHRAHVYVLHAIEVLYHMDEKDPELREWFKTLERAMERKMADEVAFFQSRGVAATGEVIIGTPWKVILRFAEEVGVDLIVIGSHGIRTEEGRVLLGTTSHKVALASKIPVLIVRPEMTGPAGVPELG